MCQICHGRRYNFGQNEHNYLNVAARRRVSDVGFWVYGKAAVVSLLVTSGGLEKRMKAEVGRMKYRLDAGLSTLLGLWMLDWLP